LPALREGSQSGRELEGDVGPGAGLAGLDVGDDDLVADHGDEVEGPGVGVGLGPGRGLDLQEAGLEVDDEPAALVDEPLEVGVDTADVLALGDPFVQVVNVRARLGGHAGRPVGRTLQVVDGRRRVALGHEVGHDAEVLDGALGHHLAAPELEGPLGQAAHNGGHRWDLVAGYRVDIEARPSSLDRWNLWLCHVTPRAGGGT